MSLSCLLFQLGSASNYTRSYYANDGDTIVTGSSNYDQVSLSNCVCNCVCNLVCHFVCNFVCEQVYWCCANTGKVLQTIPIYEGACVCVCLSHSLCLIDCVSLTPNRSRQPILVRPITSRQSNSVIQVCVATIRLCCLFVVRSSLFLFVFGYCDVSFLRCLRSSELGVVAHKLLLLFEFGYCDVSASQCVPSLCRFAVLAYYRFR